MKLLLHLDEQLRCHKFMLSHCFQSLIDFSKSLNRVFEIFQDPGYISVDYQDIRFNFDKYDDILIASGFSDDEHRITKAIHKALNNESLLSNVMNADQVIIKFLCSRDSEYLITAEEMMYDIMSFTSQLKNVKWSVGDDASLGRKVRVIIFATGFEHSKQESENDLQHREVNEVRTQLRF